MYNATLVDSTAAENAYEKAGRLVLDLENKGLNLALTEQELTGLDLIDRHWIINNWEAIQPLLAKEREQARFREIRWKIREAVWEGLISDWLAKNAKCQKGYEADTVLHWVRECLRNDQREKLIEFLADVDTGGLE